MKRNLIMIPVIVVLGFPLPAVADHVMVLGDGGSEIEVTTALLAAGHSVECSCTYHGWDGMDPSLDEFDAVVILDGIDYGQGMQTQAIDNLRDFVAAGGGLVVSEWSAWDVCEEHLPASFAELLPVVMPHCFAWSGPRLRDWIRTQPDHPILEGLVYDWSDDGGFSKVEPKAGALVVVEDGEGFPLITTWKTGGGHVVHIDHAMLYSTGTISTETMQAIINSVDYAGAMLFSDGFETGGTGAWSGAYN